MSTGTSVVDKYLEKAKTMLDQRDLLEFMTNIGKCEVLAEGDDQLLGKVLFWKTKGLMQFNSHSKALEVSELALKYCSGDEEFKLKKYQAVVHNYMGYPEKSLKIFEKLLKESNDIKLLVEAYANIVWIYFSKQRIEPNGENLTQIEHYLDLISDNIHILSSKKKVNYYNNRSIYYFYSKNYENAIKNLQIAIDYSEEKDLPMIYSNLAELYLYLEDESVSEKVSEYTKKAETLGTKYDDKLSIAKAFYTKGIAELREDQLFTALDTLYLSLDYYTQAEAYSFAFNCLKKINDIVNNYKNDCLNNINKSIKNKFKGTPFYNEIY